VHLRVELVQCQKAHQMIIDDFLNTVIAVHKTGIAGEHSYRSALEALFRSLSDDIDAINEPKRVQCGAPDFIVQIDDIALGHIEAKDLGVDLRKMKGANLDQQKRYRAALPNLVYTNCLDWDFYREGELVASVTIADYLMGIQPSPEKFEILMHLLQDFIAQRPQTITSATKLAKMMAGKAVLIKDVMGKALAEDEDLQTELIGQYQAFREHLIHDITPADFADIYAETVAYGMFAARLHDPTPMTFSRQEALELLPKSNPFLRNLFSYIAGPNLDDRLKWIIDDLAKVFQACDLAKLMASFGALNKRNDPFIHFYEDFLKEYNPKKRKARGVWYTPEPVVNFIVRAVDEVLQSEFGLPDGLADTSKVTIDWDNGQGGTHKKEVHRVQILDPATGTGTFLADVVKQIAPKIKGVAEGMWSSYIERDLIPRLHGFELLMASYAMCHMKLDMILSELGYMPTAKAKRLSVYLTNSLEEGEQEVRDLLVGLGRAITQEATEANTIKRDMPIMCVIGNPPYSGESANKGDWIMGLMEVYKKEPGGVEKLKERNPKWINDDYVKFIRMSESLIEKNGEGILGFITNHGYLDNPTFRGMRWHLLKTFDKIYVLDLHGNSKKKEVCPDGSADVNVFDIMQGVAIIIGVKTTPTAKLDKRKGGKDAKLAQVFHRELWGKRADKYQALWKEDLKPKGWTKLENRAPQYAMVMRDYELEAAYNTGIQMQKFMPVNSVGIVTARDALTIDMDREALWARVQDFAQEPDAEVLRTRYALGKDVRDWRVGYAQKDVIDNFSSDRLTKIQYRPFDTRWTYYTGNSKGFQCYPRNDVMQHFLGTKNLGICISKQQKASQGFFHVFPQSTISESCLTSNKTAEIGTTFPLYLYPR